MIDGTDIRQLDPADLRANIGAAMQESVLLTGSVRENIVLGRAGIDDEEMVRAAADFRHPPVHGPDRQRLRPAGSPTAARACRAASASRSRSPARSPAGRRS